MGSVSRIPSMPRNRTDTASADSGEPVFRAKKRTVGCSTPMHIGAVVALDAHRQAQRLRVARPADVERLVAVLDGGPAGSVHPAAPSLEPAVRRGHVPGVVEPRHERLRQRLVRAVGGFAPAGIARVRPATQR